MTPPRDGEFERAESTSSGEVERDAPVCDERDCERGPAVRLHIPWADDRLVCPAHARVLARPDGIVAEPIEGAESEWP